jgi:hypothetical protein
VARVVAFSLVRVGSARSAPLAANCPQLGRVATARHLPSDPQRRQPNRAPFRPPCESPAVAGDHVISAEVGSASEGPQLMQRPGMPPHQPPRAP